MAMKEDFLHYIWKFRLFNTTELLTTTGDTIKIISPGVHNFNAGPDFLNAQIKVGGEMWIGHAEIHIKSSDWHRHGHTDDERYHNVILHVVFDHDEDIHLMQQNDLQVLELKNVLPLELWKQYEGWLQSKNWIACQSSASQVPEIIWSSWKDRLMIERLEQKSQAVLTRLHLCRGNWPEVLYRMLARNFGFKTNADAMEMLAEALPIIILARYKSDPFQIEALLFGQAGLLEKEFDDEYPRRLRSEYIFLRKKLGLVPLKASIWNFGRVRPVNFPTIRLAQFAALISQSEQLFRTISEADDAQSIFKLFCVEAHEYWSDHYRFDEEAGLAGRRLRALGKSAIESILVNTVSVVLFAYGRSMNDNSFLEKAIKLSEICPPEDNRITKNWSTFGVTSANAAESQALIQLYNKYCVPKRCLNCQIGTQILTGTNN
jgi:hypothetical protein